MFQTKKHSQGQANTKRGRRSCFGLVGGGLTSPGTNPGPGLKGLTAFMHKTYPFIYVGDGGFLSYYDLIPVVAQCCYPFRLDSNMYPVLQPMHGDGTTKLPVCNAAFFGNMMTWIVKYIEGIQQ